MFFSLAPKSSTYHKFAWLQPKILDLEIVASHFGVNAFSMVSSATFLKSRNFLNFLESEILYSVEQLQTKCNFGSRTIRDRCRVSVTVGQRSHTGNFRIVFMGIKTWIYATFSLLIKLLLCLQIWASKQPCLSIGITKKPQIFVFQFLIKVVNSFAGFFCDSTW